MGSAPPSAASSHEQNVWPAGISLNVNETASEIQVRASGCHELSRELPRWTYTYVVVVQVIIVRAPPFTSLEEISEMKFVRTGGHLVIKGV
jgi:hypothetical protein